VHGIPCTADVPPDDIALLAPLRAASYAPEALPDAQRNRYLAWVSRWRERVRRDGIPDAPRAARMQLANPKYVLRNYLAQEAIDLAEQGDFARVNDLLDVLRRPYDEQAGHERYAAKRPEWARQRAGCSMLSCSS